MANPASTPPEPEISPFYRQGVNTYGEGCDAVFSSFYAPIPLELSFEVKDMACGSVSSILLSTDGKVYLAGRGLLRSDGVYVENTVAPIEYPMPSGIGEIAAVKISKVPFYMDTEEDGPRFTYQNITTKPTDTYFAITESGDLYGWGISVANSLAQGDITFDINNSPILNGFSLHTMTRVPTPVFIADNVQDVVSIGPSTFILKTNGDLFFVGFDQFWLNGTDYTVETLLPGFYMAQSPPFAVKPVKISDRKWRRIDGAAAYIEQTYSYFYRDTYAQATYAWTWAPMALLVGIEKNSGNLYQWVGWGQVLGCNTIGFAAYEQYGAPQAEKRVGDTGGWQDVIIRRYYPVPQQGTQNIPIIGLLTHKDGYIQMLSIESLQYTDTYAYVHAIFTGNIYFDLMLAERVAPPEVMTALQLGAGVVLSEYAMIEIKVYGTIIARVNRSVTDSTPGVAYGAIGTSGRLWGWGSNESGQAGIGNVLEMAGLPVNSVSSAPLPVHPGFGHKKISFGNTHALILREIGGEL